MISPERGGDNMSEKSSIVYQNKDVTAKYLEEHFTNKSFAVYGVKVPKVVKVLPTNLPIIEANELRLDNLFLLEDGSLALVDYESSYADEDKVKYLNYIIRTLRRNMKEEDMLRNIRMIVIYTADIEPWQTRPRLDIGCLQFQLEEAFLMKLDSEGIEADIRKKLEHGQLLTAEEQMKFIILPLTYKGKEKKRECIKRCFELAKRVEDEQEQIFVLSGMLTFADKVIDREDSKKIREWIMMTKVAQLFEEEKIEYGKKEAEKAAKAAAKEAARDIETKLVKQLLACGDSVDKIASITTILTRQEINVLKEGIYKK